MIPRRIVGVIVIAVLVQLTLFSSFSFDGARPEILVLVVLAVGHRIGPEEGAVVGFATGLAFDMFLTTPLGFTALLYLLAGYAMGRIVPSLPSAPWWLTSLVLAIGSAVTMLGQGVVGEIIGLNTLRGPTIGTIMAVVALVNLALAPAMLRIVRWLQIEPRVRRRTSRYA